MRRENEKGIRERTEEWLDERRMIAENFPERHQEKAYYEGGLKAAEMLGYSWNYKNGRHTLYK